MNKIIKTEKFKVVSFQKLSLPIKMVVVHSLIILTSMILYPTGLFTPNIPYDDVYLIYLIIPGIHIYLLSGYVSSAIFPWLQTFLSYHVSSVLCIVFIPGVIGIILGGLQWFLIGTIIMWYKNSKKVS